jgi:hypothetical protein
LTLSCAQVIGAGDYHVAGDDGGPTCTPDGLDLNALTPAIQACVWLTGCFPYKPSQNTLQLSDCVSRNWTTLQPFDACAATAKSCADVESCLGYGYANATDCPSQGAFCNGTRAATCSGKGTGAVRRCDVYNGTCKPFNGNSIAGCEVVPSCSDAEGTLHCNQNALYDCAGGVGYGQQCGASAQCRESAQGGDCYPNSLPSCSPDGTRCDGNVYVDCLASVELRSDCSAIGLSCEVEPDTTGIPTAYCLAPGCSLVDYIGCQESCDPDGTTAHICVGGAQIGIACTDFGMKSCQSTDVTDSKGNTQPYVYCRPY